MNVTEKKAYQWVLSQGYTGVIYRNRDTPDFLTSEGDNFEAKLSRNKVIWFSSGQFGKIIETGNTSILVFEIENNLPLAIISFGDFAKKPKIWQNITIRYQRDVIEKRIPQGSILYMDSASKARSILGELAAAGEYMPIGNEGGFTTYSRNIGGVTEILSVLETRYRRYDIIKTVKE